MTPIYTATFDPVEAILYVIFLGFFVYGLLIAVPGIKRKKENDGGELKAQIRVLACFGESSLRWGGVFYRFTIYDKYMAVCLFSVALYEYKQVDFRRPYRKNSHRLDLVLRGTPVSLYGNCVDLDRFVNFLSKSKDKATGS